MTQLGQLIPDATHPITVEPATGRVRVTLGDRVIAETDEALVLAESTYPPVLYLPLDAIDPEVLTASDHQTFCPYKGDASYYSLKTEDGVIPNAVWTYTDPYAAVEAIAGHVAFYPQHVTIDRA